MKDAEDEAFDDLAKRQGHWGGGFQAKRAAAADKVQEHEALKLLEDATRSCNNIDEQRALDALMREAQPAQSMKVEGPLHVVCQCNKCKAQPAQESWREFASDYERGFIDGMQKQAQSSVDKAVNMMAQPAQEPNYWLGYGLQAHTEKPFENATALYITPPKREWVGLTDEEIAGLWTSRVSWTNNNFARAIEQALKERNHGT